MCIRDRCIGTGRSAVATYQRGRAAGDNRIVSTVETPSRQGESRSCCEIAKSCDITTCDVTRFWAWGNLGLFIFKEDDYVTYYETNQTD